MKLLEKQKVYSDGRHNAFTDLIYFKKKYLLAFRNAESHLSWDGKIIILSSHNARDWEEFKKFTFAKNFDPRAPKLFLKNERMFLEFPLRTEEKGRWQSQILMTSTQNGVTFSRLKRVYRVGFVNWRPKVYKGNIYSVFYHVGEIKDFNTWESELHTSHDGLSWKYISTIYKGAGANETEIEFIGDEIIAVVRKEGKSSILARSKPPYTKWKYKNLKKQLHCPCIKKIDNKIILAAREFNILTKRNKSEIADETISKSRKHQQKVSLFLWDGKIFKESLILEKGTNIDSGYCGIELAKKDKNCIFVSYYLGTSKTSDIWIAKVKIK